MTPEVQQQPQQPQQPAAAKHTITMRDPDGITKEIEGKPEVLVPLMAKGWTQVKAAEAPVKGA